MVTLTEALSNLEKEKTEQVQLNPSKFVYNTQSGTKDIHVKMQIGGRAYKIKKVYRNPKPIFGMDEKSFEAPYSSTSRKLDHKTTVQAASGVVNISVNPKLKNLDTKVENAQTSVVYGLHKLGGTGIDFADAHIHKIEELKLLKQDSPIELQFRKFEKSNPMKSTRHGKSHGSGL